jgi:peptidoglycan/xylan/chitin deacetylase (PgdA/CDA1 family)
VKRHVRSAVDQVARLSGFLALREREAAHGVTVLTYHRVLADESCANYPFPALAMPLTAFREQVRWLVSHGDVLCVRDALDSAPGGHRPTFAISFDDGYRDSYELVAPVLDDMRVRGTFFVTTGFVHTRRMMWFDRAALLFDAVDDRARREIVRDVCGTGIASRFPAPRARGAAWTNVLKRQPAHQREAVLTWLEWILGGSPRLDGFEPMTFDQVAELHRRGHEIGSHSVTHPVLTELDDASLHREVDDAHQVLRSRLGTTVAGFCYPNGNHDERVVRSVVRSGHTYACSTRQGIHARGDDRYRIQRIDIVRDRVTRASRRLDVTGFRRELCGLYRRARSP